MRNNRQMQLVRDIHRRFHDALPPSNPGERMRQTNELALLAKRQTRTMKRLYD